MNYSISFLLLLMTTLFMPLSINANEVSRANWMNSMSYMMPTLFCESGQFIRQCFKVKQAECKETTRYATRLCLKKIIIPARLNLPNDGAYWGEVVGECVGEMYFEMNNERYVNNQECNDPSNW